MARRCEELRDQLQDAWFGDKECECWGPKCQIVIHASRASYLGAVGAGAGSTSGCSSLKVEAGKITLRRIDVLGEDSQRLHSALSHEMTHVVLADYFVKKNAPRWADEGMAILADSDAKQKLHRTDMTSALKNRQEFRLGELLVTDDYPSPQRVPIFYGQSASIVQFLCDRKSRPHFLQFVDRSSEVGYDRALRDIYEIDGVATLEALWRKEH